MFSKLFAITAVSAIIGVYADVTPTVPGPSDSYDEGASCVIAWTGGQIVDDGVEGHGHRVDVRE